MLSHDEGSILICPIDADHRTNLRRDCYNKQSQRRSPYELVISVGAHMIDRLTLTQQNALLQLTDAQVHEVFRDAIQALEYSDQYRVARPLEAIEPAVRVLVVLARQAIYESRLKEVINVEGKKVRSDKVREHGGVTVLTLHNR